MLLIHMKNDKSQNIISYHHHFFHIYGKDDVLLFCAVNLWYSYIILLYLKTADIGCYIIKHTVINNRKFDIFPNYSEINTSIYDYVQSQKLYNVYI